MEELKRKERGWRGCGKTYMHDCARTCTLESHIETQKAVRLPDFIKVNCRSEGADLGYKTRMRVQVKAMKRN